MAGRKLADRLEGRKKQLEARLVLEIAAVFVIGLLALLILSHASSGVWWYIIVPIGSAGVVLTAIDAVSTIRALIRRGQDEAEKKTSGGA
ncbi:MAG TPA: hypothetical protein ENN09_03665 [Planctomycetes bacterium]|nr:hypothetical protein [Planctomycetota bacterium]